MSLRDPITPETIAAILKAANPRNAEGHRLNQNHELIRKCRLGAVFVNRAGDLCVYTGIDGRSRSRPVLFTRIDDRTPRKGPIEYLAKIVAASQQENPDG